MINLFNGEVWQWHEQLMPGWYTSEEAYNEANGIIPNKEVKETTETTNQVLPEKTKNKK